MDYNTDEMRMGEKRDDYLPGVPSLPPVLPPHIVNPPTGLGQHTRNYGLPLWRASDITSWLSQMNAAMMRIDEVMHDLALRTGVNGMPDDITASVSELLRDTEVMKANLADLSNKAANQELLYQNAITQLTALKTDLGSVQLSLTNLDTRIMTAESKSENVQQNIAIVKSDLLTINTAVKSFRETFSQFQVAVNKNLAEFEVRLKKVEDVVTDFDVQHLGSDTGEVTGKITAANLEAFNSCTIDGITTDGIRFEIMSLPGGLGWVYFRTANNNKFHINGKLDNDFGYKIILPTELEVELSLFDNGAVLGTAIAVNEETGDVYNLLSCLRPIINGNVGGGKGKLTGFEVRYNFYGNPFGRKLTGDKLTIKDCDLSICQQDARYYVGIEPAPQIL